MSEPDYEPPYDPEVDFREPPNDTNTEAALLGVLIWQPRELDELDLRPEEFYRPAFGQLYGLLVHMRASGDVVDPVTVAARLATQPIRGFDLAAISTRGDNHLAASVRKWASIIRDKARLRRAWEAGRRVTAAVESGQHEADEVEALLAREADLCGQHDQAAQDDARPFSELFTAALDRWDTPASSDRVTPTGWHDLDHVLAGGLRPGHLMVVGARPAVGKTQVAVNLAASIAATGSGVYFASLEMPSEEITDRLTANVAGVDLNKLITKRLDDLDWQRLSRMAGPVNEWPLWVDGRPNLSVAQVKAKARQVGRRMPMRVVIVDYLQRMKSHDRNAQRHLQVGYISAGLKLLARELDVCVVALAQVNRAGTARTEGRPTMADLRESGDIEADADEIVLLHRDDKNNPGVIEFIVEKNRHGATRALELGWAPHVSRIVSLAKEAA